MRTGKAALGDELRRYASNDDWCDRLHLLHDKVLAASDSQRFLLGIVGPPGAGKSWLSSALVSWINSDAPAPGPAIVVPMDGFHLSNERLETIGLRHLKGIPETFDAESFVGLLRELRLPAAHEVDCPRFDRTTEASIPAGIRVQPEHKLIVVEGNYLLLQKAPWNQVRTLLDAVWYINAHWQILESRLVRRHAQALGNQQAACDKVRSTDEPNARLVEDTRHLADYVLEQRELISSNLWPPLERRLSLPSERASRED